MGTIDIYNYEVYLLDYSEGNLTDEQICNLELFAILNPHLEIDLCDLEFESVDIDNSHFNDNVKLKKTEFDLVSENQFVAYIENQLTESEKKHVDLSCLTNQVLADELVLYKKSILIADDFIVYPNPNELKRKNKFIWFNFSPFQFAAAASVVLFIGLFFLFGDYSPTLKPYITMVKSNALEIKINVDDSFFKKKTMALIHNESHIVNPNLKSVSNSKEIPISKKNDIISVAVLNETIKQNNVIDSIGIQNRLVTEKVTLSTINKVNKSITQDENTEVLSNKVSVISEYETQENSIKQNKNGIWAIASRTLNRLNKIGIKYVNGSEISNKEYALNLGRLSVKHHKALEN
jgi:hypothetical protein